MYAALHPQAERLLRGVHSMTSISLVASLLVGVRLHTSTLHIIGSHLNVVPRLALIQNTNQYLY